MDLLALEEKVTGQVTAAEDAAAAALVSDAQPMQQCSMVTWTVLRKYGPKITSDCGLNLAGP